MNEWLMILGMSLGGILFAAGGTDIPKIGGQKWLRRFILPLALGGIAVFTGNNFWSCAIFTVGTSIAFHLPYGSKHSYWIKSITAIAFTLPSLVFGFSFWMILTPVLFISMFWLSNSKYFSSLFPWKIVEFLTGVFIAVTFILSQ